MQANYMALDPVYQKNQFLSDIGVDDYLNCDPNIMPSEPANDITSTDENREVIYYMFTMNDNCISDMILCTGITSELLFLDVIQCKCKCHRKPEC